MSDDASESPLIALALALDVPRHARRGFAVGALLAVVAYAYRVGALGGPAPARGSPLLFLLLAFVLAVSAGALVTLVLTVRSAVRLARRPDRRE